MSADMKEPATDASSSPSSGSSYNALSFFGIILWAGAIVALVTLNDDDATLRSFAASLVLATIGTGLFVAGVVGRALERLRE